MGKHTLACSNFFRIFRLCQQRRHSPAQIAAPRSNSMTCHPASHAPAARSCATWAIRRSACNLAAPLKPALGQTARQANEHCGTSATYPPLSQRALAVLVCAGGAWPNFWPQQTSPPARPSACLFARHTSAKRPNSAPGARSPVLRSTAPQRALRPCSLLRLDVHTNAAAQRASSSPSPRRSTAHPPRAVAARVLARRRRPTSAPQAAAAAAVSGQLQTAQSLCAWTKVPTHAKETCQIDEKSRPCVFIIRRRSPVTHEEGRDHRVKNAVSIQFPHRFRVLPSTQHRFAASSAALVALARRNQ